MCSILSIIHAETNYLIPPEIINATANPNFTLHVVNHTADVRDGENNLIATVQIRAYRYNNKTHFIGPTIVARPGHFVNVTLVNDLVGVGRAIEISDELQHEGYKDPDVTNLHTHGLYQIYIMCSVNI